MARGHEIARTYDWMSDMLKRGLGPHADVTAAYYNGNFTQTLEQAQAAKHQYVLDSVGFRRGMRVADIGSGWGNMLKAIKDRGGLGVGFTLSPTQAEECRKRGLDARLKDWKDLTPQQIGSVDAVVSIGAMEHFCSPEEFRNGQQDQIYRDFFRLGRNVLPENGRMFVQTMVWENMPDPDSASLQAPKDSNEFLFALLEKFYPGSWLPNGKEQVIEAAEAEGFALVEVNSGRDDYIQTMKEWGDRTRRMTPKLLWGRAKLAPKYVTDADFRLQIQSLRNAANRKMFERGVMNHFRMTFEKT